VAQYYAYTPALDPNTRDWAVGVDRPAGSPATQMVLLVLNTQLGSYAPDPTFGTNHAIARKATPNVAADWRAEVLRALGGLVRRGVIADLVVAVDPPAGGRALLYDVSLRDPRAADPKPITLRRLRARAA
jgi:hypothetical protein